MVIVKNKVTNGVTWCPVSHGVSPKGGFDCSKSAKIALKMAFSSVLLRNEAIKIISNLFYNFFLFFTKIFRTLKNTLKKLKNKK